MTRPGRYLFVMLVFLAVLGAGAYVWFDKLHGFFLANPVLNAIVLGLLAAGIVYCFWQVVRLFPEVTWIKNYQRDRTLTGSEPHLLGGLARIIGERQGKKLRLTAGVTRSLADGIGVRLDESREISRYLIALLVFLGLLGTFWGLLETIGAVVKTIESLFVTGGDDFAKTFEKFKRGLLDTLQSSGTAFSTSLFGLGGSLILGFLDLQAGQAQNRFYTETEDWLSGMTRLSVLPADADGDSIESVSGYLQALLEHTAGSMDDVRDSIARGESERATATKSLQALVDRLGMLTDQMRAEQNLLARLAEAQIEMKPILARLADDNAFGRQEIVNALRGELRVLTNRMAEVQLEMRPYLQRMVEDNAQSRHDLVRELRNEFTILARAVSQPRESPSVRVDKRSRPGAAE
jgi:hypothetical protein